MRLIVTDGVVWSVCLSVGRSVTIFSHAKMAEPNEIPFGVWTWVGPRNPVLVGVQIPLCAGAILRRKRYLHGKWLAERARSTILLQQNPSFGEKLDQVHFSCRKLCWQVAQLSQRDRATP